MFQIYCCFDEYKEYGFHQTVPFSGKAYESVYDGMEKLIEDIKADKYHAKKYRERRARWAKEGM